MHCTVAISECFRLNCDIFFSTFHGLKTKEKLRVEVLNCQIHYHSLMNFKKFGQILGCHLFVVYTHEFDCGPVQVI